MELSRYLQKGTQNLLKKNLKLDKWLPKKINITLSWLYPGGRVDVFSSHGISIQTVATKRVLEKAVVNPGLQEMLIPIFYRRGFVWGGRGQEWVLFKAHRVGLHA